MTVAERRQRDRAHRRQAIITAARQMAEAEGWDAVTTRRLADRIEYSQPVLYSHFEGKVAIVSAVRHRRYGKTMQRTTRFYAHDETNDVREGDRVRITETRPLSKNKHWRVVEILERAR
jgi:ribosomal protein S17